MSRLGVVLCGLLVAAIVCLVLLFSWNATSRRVTLGPEETPFQDVLKRYSLGDYQAAWTGLRETGARRSLLGSSYKSLRMSEKSLRLTLPWNRRPINQELSALSIEIMKFAGQSTIDLDIANNSDDAAEAEKRLQTIQELAAQLSSGEHLLIYEQVGQALEMQAEARLMEARAEAIRTDPITSDEMVVE